MEDMKSRFAGVIAAELTAAPDSTAKAELIEELSENLYQRYQAELSAGQSEEAAYRAAVDSLGDTAELVAYLRELDPGAPLPPPDWESDDPLEDILRSVKDICQDAMKKARSALDEVRADLEQGGCRRRSGGGNGNVHVYTTPSEEDLDSLEDEFEALEHEFEDGERREDKGRGRSLHVDAAAGGPSPEREEDKGGSRTAEDPDAPISAQALKGIEVQVDGDVTLRMTEPAEGDVVIGGDVDELQVFRSDDGVLTIRQIRTASSAFLFRRGLSTVDVELDLPCRPWEFLRIHTVSGEVEVNGGETVDQLTVQTSSGGLSGGLPRCRKVYFRSVSGDLDWSGDADELDIETVSGDVTWGGGAVRSARCRTTSGDIHWDGDADQAQMFSISGGVIVNGRIDRFQASTTSGEVELAGSFHSVRCSSLSGGLRVESDVLPQTLDMKTTSGDCEARVPDSGSFAVRYKTTSGSFRSDFFTGRMSGRSNTFIYFSRRGDGPSPDHAGGGEAGPEYHFTSLSGDLALYKL